MGKIIGALLRALSVVWFMFAIVRIIFSMTGILGGVDIFVGLLEAGVAIATFKFGTWLKSNPPGPSLMQRVSRFRSGWWRKDYKFRLVVFLAGIWMVGSFFLARRWMV